MILSLSTMGVFYFSIYPLRRPLAFFGILDITLLSIGAFFMRNALNLFSKIGNVSTNMALIAVGITVVRVVVLAAAVLLVTLLELVKGRIKYS